MFKNQPKKDDFEVPPEGVDQLLHVDQLWWVDKNIIFCSFSDVFCWFQPITEKGLKWTKKVESGWKKCFEQLLGASSTQKLVKIHNTLFIKLLIRRTKSLVFISCYFGLRLTLCYKGNFLSRNLQIYSKFTINKCYSSMTYNL